MSKPLVAIVGRPNVGKSTLINGLAQRRVSIVEDIPGVTRDRIYCDVKWLDREFTLIDTGGIEFKDERDQISSGIRQQAELAIDEADVILFVVDARTGMTADDETIAGLLRRTGKPVVLCVNKVDSENQEMDVYEFYSLGLGDPVGISAVNRLGFGELLDRITEGFPARTEESSEDIIRTAIVGRPNVGKSTLLSRVTNAQPKIANYHFTTLQPNLGVVDLDGAKGFVIADIPGLIEGASEGVGLGLEFLRHIERTKVMIHMVDAAGTEGRDPVADIIAINKELEAYDPALLKKPQVIAANKMDAVYGDENEIIQKLKDTFEKDGIRVFPISAVSGKGLKELLYCVSELLDQCSKEPVVYEPEFDPALRFFKDEPYTITVADDGAFVVEGPKIEKMLGYTNMDSEKGFLFFQKFMKEQGILKDLEAQGIEDGDTVRMYGFEFDYYK